MQAPLAVLAALALIAGFTGLYPRAFSGVLSQVLEPEGAVRGAVLSTSLVVLVVGAGLALVLYGSAAVGRAGAAAAGNPLRDPIESSFPVLFGALVTLRDSFDRAYDYYIAKVQQRFAMLLNFLDLLGIGGLMRAIAGVIGVAGLQTRAVNVGRLNVYVYWFLAGVAVLWAFAAGIF
jgi:NADH-quinone oxidoreductase subunit L